MFPEDRVLVAVINRQRDLHAAAHDHWYRIPQERMTRGIHAEYLAFYLSRAFKHRNGGVHFFAETRGLELAKRRDLLPGEPNHKNADRVYYRVALSELREKVPPVMNPTRRPISFIYTTWDRFVHARTISDLYSETDYYVDRIYHALRDHGVNPLRLWHAEQRDDADAPGVRILCERGEVVASANLSSSALYMDPAQKPDVILQEILLRVASSGGPLTMSIPPIG